MMEESHTCVITIPNRTLLGLRVLLDTLRAKTVKFAHIIKTGRTHCQDATPLTHGQEFSGYAQLVEYGIRRVESSMVALYRVALGPGGARRYRRRHGIEHRGGIRRRHRREDRRTHRPFVSAPNLFEALAAHESPVEMSGSLRPRKDCDNVPVCHHVSASSRPRISFYSCTTLLVHYLSVLMSNLLLSELFLSICSREYSDINVQGMQQLLR
jgi:aspartate ammonia-lyase